jgi:hypothetical protein
MNHFVPSLLLRFAQVVPLSPPTCCRTLSQPQGFSKLLAVIGSEGRKGFAKQFTHSHSVVEAARLQLSRIATMHLPPGVLLINPSTDFQTLTMIILDRDIVEDKRRLWRARTMGLTVTSNRYSRPATANHQCHGTCL